MAIQMVWQPVRVHMDIEMLTRRRRAGSSPGRQTTSRRSEAPRRVEWGHEEVHEVESFKREVRLLRKSPPWAKKSSREFSGINMLRELAKRDAPTDDTTTAESGAAFFAEDAPTDDTATAESGAAFFAEDAELKHGTTVENPMQPMLPAGPKPLRLARRLRPSSPVMAAHC